MGGIGAFAGEVQEPGRTYPLAVAGGVLLTWLTFLVPVITGLTFSVKLHHWQEGYYEDMAKEFALSPSLSSSLSFPLAA